MFVMTSYSFQLSVDGHKPLVRFGLMHVAATNMCVWIRVLVFEVMEAIHESKGHHLHPLSQAVLGKSKDTLMKGSVKNSLSMNPVPGLCLGYKTTPSIQDSTTMT